MSHEHILSFVEKLSKSLKDKIATLDNKHPLSIEWLQNNYDKEPEKNDKGVKVEKTFRPHSFGGSFVITPVHTPFKKIHSVAEDLMSEAKKSTDRNGNSVNWLIMSADEEPEINRLIDFEKPVFIQEPDKRTGTVSDDYLLFIDYLELTKKHKGLSGSHTQQIIGKIIEFKKDAGKLETWLKRLPASRSDSSAISGILKENKENKENKLKSNGKLNVKRLATLLELMSI